MFLYQPEGQFQQTHYKVIFLEDLYLKSAWLNLKCLLLLMVYIQYLNKTGKERVVSITKYDTVQPLEFLRCIAKAASYTELDQFNGSMIIAREKPRQVLRLANGQRPK